MRLLNNNINAGDTVFYFLFAFLLIAFTPFSVFAEAEWEVPTVSEPLRIEAEGNVEISRFSVQTIRTGSPGAIVSWIGPDGKHAEFGDELMRLDTEGLKRHHQRLRDGLAVLRRSSSNQVLALEKVLAQEEEAMAARLEDLEVKTAEARATAKPDASEIATLRREIELAKREAALQEADLTRMKRLLEIGELARIEVEDAELALTAARRRVRIAELQLEDAGDGSDPVLARRAAWRVERARVTIGVDADGKPRDNRGYGKKLAAIRRKLERLRTSLRKTIEAKEVELQGVTRAAWPHLPLREWRILSGEDVIHRLKATDPDAASVYDAARGRGWVEAPVTSPSTNALVIRGPAQWRCDLPPGDYKMEFDLGGGDEWTCMSVKSGDRVLVAENRLSKGQTKTCKADLRVGEGGLLLDVGLAQKAVLASQAGAVKNQNWVHLGYPINNNPPALYLTPSAQLVVKFRVHHLQVPFFEKSDAATRRLELRNSMGEWVPGGKVKINEEPMPFYLSKDSQHKGDIDEGPEERTAREVVLTVPAEVHSGFAFAAHAVCRAVCEPKDGAVTIPAFLVHEGKDGLFVRRDGRLVRVSGTRYDQHFLLTEGLAPGDRLSRPNVEKTESGDNRFTGEVVAGASVPMVVPTRSWARIKNLIPHGSAVKKGDLVVTLYRPEENEKSVKAEAKAVAAEVRFLETVDEQQNALLRETDAHARVVQEEKLAADRVAENRRLDLAPLASAAEAERAAKEELKLLEARVAALEGKESTRLAYEDYRRRRDILRLQTRSQKLNAIAAFRRVDYTTQLQDRLNWRKARRELAIREAQSALSLKEQKVMRQRALNLLEDDVEDRTIGRDFETMRFMKAPVDGHVFYLRGYNDLARRRERIDKEFIVWHGLTLAEILDTANLSFRISLPESHYYAIRTGMEMPIELEDLDDRILVGRVTTKGRSLYEPRKNGKRGEEAIGLTRLFDVTLSIAVPEDLRDRLRPGLRGAVTLL